LSSKLQPRGYANQRQEVVEILANHQGINLNVKNKTGNNAFYWVIENYEIAKILLETGKLHIKDMKAQYIH
jgi:hypothetical protein